MLAQEWMTNDVVTITPDTSIMKASRLMKERRIRRLPVVNEAGAIVGIISDRDIKAASPSKATTLEVHELYYLLSELKAKDIMTKKPVCAHKEDSIEGIACLMAQNSFGGVPILDDGNRVCGIITDSDIFKVFLSVTGAGYGGLQLTIAITDNSSQIHAIMDVLHSCEALIASLLTSKISSDSNEWRVYIRLLALPSEKEKIIIEQIKKEFSLLYWETGQESCRFIV